jgi:hypothetical protein
MPDALKVGRSSGQDLGAVLRRLKRRPLDH